MSVVVKRIHPVAGAIALAMIVTFWLSTVVSELFASDAAVIAVKRAIPWGFLVLIPALAAAGGSGFGLAKGRREGLLGAKARRMPLIGANGVLVLVPAALFLAYKAGLHALDGSFYAVQVAELAAGAVNITLLGLNLRDGLRMRARHLRPAG